MSNRSQLVTETSERRELEARVATGLLDPVRIRALDLTEVVPVKVTEHAMDRWHLRVMSDRSFLRATVRLVELLESGGHVRSRRHPFRWVKGRSRNLLYFSLGPNVLLPAESSPEDGFELEIVTCLTNPCSDHPLRDDARHRPSRRRSRLRRPGRR